MTFKIPDVPISPWPHLLSHNVVPTTLQAACLRTSVETAEKGISLLDAELSDLHRIVQQLTTRRLELKAYARTHRVVFSAARHVPEDVWGEVLLRAIQDESNQYARLCALGSVCRSWRNLVVSSPPMWTQIVVGLDRSSSNPTALAGRLPLQLSRSGGLPVTLRLGFLNGQPVARRLLELVLPLMKRVNNLVSTLTPEQLHYLATSGADFAQLRSLDLAMKAGSFMDNEKRLFASVVHFKLHFISDAPPNTLTLGVRWAQLLDCELSHCSSLQITEILPLLGTQTNLVLSGTTATEAVRKKHVVSQIPTLVLTDMAEQSVEWLLEMLVAPRLEKISLQPDLTKISLHAFLARSSCSLTHLGITADTQSDTSLVYLLELLESDALRNLTHFDCRSTSTETLLNLLTNTPELLPHLKALTLRSSEYTGLNQSLRRYLQSRTPASPSVWMDKQWSGAYRDDDGASSHRIRTVAFALLHDALGEWREAGEMYDVRMGEDFPVPHLW
uniref:F-box domain-containing protein n=1 Tax=Mycena chlorophos TaxID=658473 RepID=A0ABQ0KX12_MYCCL|nr:predicted protein [Mycena chlorophos]